MIDKRNQPAKLAGTVIAAVLLTFLIAQIRVLADTPAWTYKGTGEAKWHSLLETGNLLVGSDTAVTSVNSENGKVIWERTDIGKINEDQTHEIKGTPILLVSNNRGTFQKFTKLYALNVQTGKDLWSTEKLKGATIQVTPIPEKGLIVILTVQNQMMNKDKLDIIAINAVTGEVKWENQFEEKVDLYEIEGRNGFMQTPRYDLSGESAPVFDGDSIYFTYAGLHRYSLSDGKLLWKVRYDVTEGMLKKTNAPAIVEKDTIYTSAKGVIRAINKTDGALKWTSPDFNKGGVTEMKSFGENLYCRFGGWFYDGKKNEYIKKDPFGVVAVDKQNGTANWIYKGAKGNITNMVIAPESNELFIADEKNLIVLDLSNSGKVQEKYIQKLEFKYKLGAAATVATIGKFAFGGLSAIGKKGADTTDDPIQLSRRENGTIVVRGKQHVLAFEPKTRTIPWSVQYTAPGVAGWQKIVMTALTVVSAALSNAQENASASRGDWNSAGRSNDQFINSMNAYAQFMEKRFSATQQTGNFVYVLTDFKRGDEKGAGLIGVNMNSGEGAKRILFKDKKPDYLVDELTGRLFNLNDGQIFAFNITDALPEELAAERDKAEGKKK